jgi:hypothetical protein
MPDPLEADFPGCHGRSSTLLAGWPSAPRSPLRRLCSDLERPAWRVRGPDALRCAVVTLARFALAAAARA